MHIFVVLCLCTLSEMTKIKTFNLHMKYHVYRHCNGGTGGCRYNNLRRHQLRRSPLLWRHDGHDGVSNYQPHGCLLNRLFGRRSNKTSKLRFTGLCVGNSPGIGEFLAQMTSNTENVSIWWRHHATRFSVYAISCGIPYGMLQVRFTLFHQSVQQNVTSVTHFHRVCRGREILRIRYRNIFNSGGFRVKYVDAF